MDVSYLNINDVTHNPSPTVHYTEQSRFDCASYIKRQVQMSKLIRSKRHKNKNISCPVFYVSFSPVTINLCSRFNRNCVGNTNW